MVVVLSGGGTAGHINPALALAEELSARGATVYFAGTPEGLEARLVPEAGIPYQAFEASGFDRKRPLSLFKGIAKIERSSQKAKKWFAEIDPDVVVGFGGYVSIPVAHAAEALGIPVVVHEQNSVMGLANKYLAKKATAVCLTYEHAAKALDASTAARVEVTGNPVRSQVLRATRAEGRALLGVPDDAELLVAFGGSLGARHLNEALTGLKDDLLARPGLHVVHVTGPKELERATEALALTPAQAERWHVMGYLDQMEAALAAADAVVSRAGATSLAEIAARAVPALLVPFPYATEDHQTTNARAYVDAGCAAMLADADLTDAHGAPSQAFRDQMAALVDDAGLREAMAQAARAQKASHAAENLADVVCRVA